MESSGVETPILVVVAVVCAAAAAAWARSARLRWRFTKRVEREAENEADADPETSGAAVTLARASFRREVHAASLYGVLAGAALVVAFVDSRTATAVLAFVAFPAVVSMWWARGAARETRLWKARLDIERRAEEALAQEDLAPRAWAGRLAPDDLPEFTGFEVGRVYQAGSGLMAGDFFDLYRVGETRMAAVIGDVAGRGIDASITAFQAKYLLRVFLRQFRDPAQALEELNVQMSSVDRGEEFISLVIVVFDTEPMTMRYASAGHPTAFLWHEREVQPLSATGPLLMLDAAGKYFSREIPLEENDVVLLYTDGLAEVRSGGHMFGEERIAQLMRRDPGVSPEVLCKTLIEAARDFSDKPIDDDVAILAIRRS